MTWDEVRANHRDCWVLVEALRAHSADGHRVLEDLAVVATFADSPAALRAYASRHREMPQRELYVAHTSCATLDVTERTWLGVRALP